MSACLVCGSERVRILYPSTVTGAVTGSSSYYVPTYSLARLHREISRCESCGFVFVSDPLPESELSRAYADMEDPLYLEEAAAYRAAADWILARLDPFRTGPSRLLEVGCGAGFFLERARARGWDARGIELSRWMVERARERVPAEVVGQGSYESGHFREIAFDALVAVDVIEHVPNPAHFLADAGSRLKPGGIAYLVTPDMGSFVARALGERWWYIQVPHLSYFDRASLGRLAERCGLCIVWRGGYPRFVTAQTARDRLGFFPPLVRRAAGMLLRPWFALNGSLRVDLGDQLAMLCRKVA